MVLFIEDQALVAELCCRRLSELMPELRFMAAGSGCEGLALAHSESPALVFLDLGLPDVEGFELVAPLRGLSRPPAIVLFTGRLDAAMLLQSAKMNFAGLLWKVEATGLSLQTAVSMTLAGARYVSPQFIEGYRRLRADPTGFDKLISATEQQLLPWFGRGLSDDEIAKATGLTAGTIKSHRQHIMAKLDLHSTRELLRWTMEKGFAFQPHAEWSGVR